jgi:hypothetical protein
VDPIQTFGICQKPASKTVDRLLSFREFFKTVLDRIASQTIAACAASVAPSIFMITRIYNQPSVSTLVMVSRLVSD